MWKISIRFSSFQNRVREPLLQSVGSASHRTIHIPYNRQQSGGPTSIKEPIDRITKDAEIPEVSSWWDNRFPETRIIQVKERGRSARWKSVNVVLTQHRDKIYRQRRVWFTFNGDEPTEEDFALKWPKEKMAVSHRTLRDDEEAQCRHGETPRIFTVMQKTDASGRSFWREVIKTDESTDEEEDESWDEWMGRKDFTQKLSE